VTEERRRQAQSIRMRLDSLARSRGDDVQLVLTRYANERVLARLAACGISGRFVLKGAALFTAWIGEPHRATRDLDLLGHGASDVETVRDVFEQVLRTEIGDDGVEFDVESMSAGPIREDQDYGGLRLVFPARIANARIRVQIDIGFGDAITPAPELLEFPTLLDEAPLRLWSYPRAAVVAEKLEALAQLGLANSRMKDFFDVALLAERFEFDGSELVAAIQTTFSRRGTPLPEATPIALTSAFTEDPSKLTQWGAFLRKSGVMHAPSSLDDVVRRISEFALEPLQAAAARRPWKMRWPPGGPWAG